MILIKQEQLYSIDDLVENHIIKGPNILDNVFFVEDENQFWVPWFFADFLQKRKTNPDYDTHIDPFLIMDLMPNVNQDDLYTGIEVLVEEINNEDFILCSDLPILNELYGEKIEQEIFKHFEPEWMTELKQDEKYQKILRLLNIDDEKIDYKMVKPIMSHCSYTRHKFSMHKFLTKQKINMELEANPDFFKARQGEEYARTNITTTLCSNDYTAFLQLVPIIHGTGKTKWTHRKFLDHYNDIIESDNLKEIYKLFPELEKAKSLTEKINNQMQSLEEETLDGFDLKQNKKYQAIIKALNIVADGIEQGLKAVEDIMENTCYRRFRRKMKTYLLDLKLCLELKADHNFLGLDRGSIYFRKREGIRYDGYSAFIKEFKIPIIRGKFKTQWIHKKFIEYYKQIVKAGSLEKAYELYPELKEISKKVNRIIQIKKNLEKKLAETGDIDWQDKLNKNKRYKGLVKLLERIKNKEEIECGSVWDVISENTFYRVRKNLNEYLLREKLIMEIKANPNFVRTEIALDYLVYTGKRGVIAKSLREFAKKFKIPILHGRRVAKWYHKVFLDHYQKIVDAGSLKKAYELYPQLKQAGVEVNSLIKQKQSLEEKLDETQDIDWQTQLKQDEKYQKVLRVLKTVNWNEEVSYEEVKETISISTYHREKTELKNYLVQLKLKIEVITRPEFMTGNRAIDYFRKFNKISDSNKYLQYIKGLKIPRISFKSGVQIWIHKAFLDYYSQITQAGSLDKACELNPELEQARLLTQKYITNKNDTN